MKIEITGKTVTLTSESVREAQEFTALYFETRTPKVERAPIKRRRGSRRYRKECPECGKKVKGLKLHMRFMHGDLKGKRPGGQ